jgi:hypothetical protein
MTWCVLITHRACEPLKRGFDFLAVEQDGGAGRIPMEFALLRQRATPMAILAVGVTDWV